MALYKPRCQHNPYPGDPRGQCCLVEGHLGNHKSSYDWEYEQKVNREPTLSDMRKMVQEEVRKALKEFFPENPSS